MTRCADRGRSDRRALPQAFRLAAAAALALTLAACGSTPTKKPVKPAPTTTTTPPATTQPPAPVVNKGDPDQRFKAALKLMKDKQNAEALAAFKSLAADFPEMSGPLTDLGILYAQAKQRDPAISAFSKAVDANPQNAVAANWLGTLYRESSQYARAEQSYRKAVEAKPDYAAAHFNLAILYDAYMSRPQQALDEYRSYLSLKGGEDLRVQAWMKALEAKTAGAPAPVGATTATTPAAPAAAKTETRKP